MNIIMIILVMTLATYPVRVISLFVFSNLNLSPKTLRILSLIPIAVLSAICSPRILYPSGNWENPLMLIEVWSALCAIIVSRYGMLPSITVGIGIYVLGNTFN
ncbi:MAG: AzlD domain-containing protein [Pseudomonadota bacterium]|nr:AzlD domain-containing protein [Pseudomonadota bacterium]